MIPRPGRIGGPGLLVRFVGINPSLRSAEVGQQQEAAGGRPVWVLPNPSGLNAHYKPADFARRYAEARRYAATVAGSK